MANRIFNFSAGPCTLPLPALEKAQTEFVDYLGAGMSLLEMSHRGKHYDDVHYATIANIREVLNVPESHDVLFIQGGATLQFAMVPLNLMIDGKSAEFQELSAQPRNRPRGCGRIPDAFSIYETRRNAQVYTAFLKRWAPV